MALELTDNLRDNLSMQLNINFASGISDWVSDGSWR